MSETENKPPERRIDVDDGKYTFILKAGEYRVHVLRHNEPWLVIEQGTNAVWSLVAELIDAKAIIEVVRAWVGIGTAGAHHAALAEEFRKYQAERGEAEAARTEAPADASTWRTGAAPYGVRCLVTAPHPSSGISRVFVASLSPDHHDGGAHAWFKDGERLHGVIAWMPAPEPAAAQNGAA
jgi:hypothetical protein